MPISDHRPPVQCPYCEHQAMLFIDRRFVQDLSIGAASGNGHWALLYQCPNPKCRQTKTEGEE